jgi:hypothetical protein
MLRGRRLSQPSTPPAVRRRRRSIAVAVLALAASVSTVSLSEMPANAAYDSAFGLYFNSTGTDAELSGFDVCSGDLVLPATVTNGIDTITVTSLA